MVGIRRAAQASVAGGEHYVAYQKAKEICYRQLPRRLGIFTTCRGRSRGLARARALMGDDFWSYGVEGNSGNGGGDSLRRRTARASSTASFPRELFAPSTLSLSEDLAPRSTA
jgi:hypothetical protein